MGLGCVSSPPPPHRQPLLTSASLGNTAFLAQVRKPLDSVPQFLCNMENSNNTCVIRGLF